MSQAPPPRGGEHDRPDGDDGAPLPWQGAPGYTPIDPDALVPHSPMPGAPPYPPRVEPPPAPVGTPPRRTGFGRALTATAGWAVVNIILVAAVGGLPPTVGAGVATAAAIVGTLLVAAGLTWLVTRGHRWPFWALVLVAAAFYWVLRAATTAGAG